MVQSFDNMCLLQPPFQRPAPNADIHQTPEDTRPGSNMQLLRPLGMVNA
jgi:hypothetical protein